MPLRLNDEDDQRVGGRQRKGGQRMSTLGTNASNVEKTSRWHLLKKKERGGKDALEGVGVPKASGAGEIRYTHFRSQRE